MNRPILYPVESSTISHVGYDPETRVLTLVFGSGKRYDYSEVEREVFDGLLSAPSKGSYFRSEIDDCYAYRQVKNWR